jgi:SAM-dependent methyltransferase
MHDPEIADYFDREAPGWDRKYGRSHRFARRRQEIARAIHAYARPGRLGLDYGCGSGALTDLVLGKCARVVAADASPAMARLARERFRADPRVSVVAPESVEPGAHDLVLCSSVVEYVRDDDAFVARLVWFAARGALLVITFPHRRGPLQLWSRWVLAHARPDSWVHRQRHVYTVRGVRDRLTRHGLEILEARASIGLPVCSPIGLGDLILAAGRRPA